ncbi:MAG TPA: metallophosphoesterase [Acidobacteriaceae bacterium]|nr:metallophosphoesterase [Acidobacteriaceae bacterium]
MPDDYSYRDARLSMWQAAVGELQRKYDKAAADVAALRATPTRPAALAPEDELMRPVHFVARAAKDAGKPFDFLVHEVKKVGLDIEAKFDPLKDCAEAAANFLRTELDGNEADSELYAGELKKSVCDDAGWAECLTTYLGYKALLKSPVYRPNENVVVDLGTKTRLAILGDWGTGEEVAINLLQQVAALKPEVLLHLGDVYYAGTQHEAEYNFLDICRSELGDIPIYSLCGNHDMYSGGQGYYWLLDQIGQKASYFSLYNDDWLFVAMDTGFHDNNPLNVSTNMTKLVEQENWSETSWLLKQIAQAGNRKLVLLSHHQLFSPFSSVGSVDAEAYAYNPNLYAIFAPLLPKVEWWFWGHEHTLGIFPPYMGLRRGRCVGASAVPVFSDQQQYATAGGLKTLNDMPMPTWDPNGVLGTTDNMYNNCFAMMTLNGASATVEYYEVPLLQAARKFNVVDVV